MIKNEGLLKKRSRKTLNDLIFLYEINYLKLIKLFPIQKSEKYLNFIIPEGVNNSEIRVSIDRSSQHTSKLTLYKSDKASCSKLCSSILFLSKSW